MAVDYPVCDCATCGHPIQGPMVLMPTGTSNGRYTAEPLHAKCAAQSFAAESASQVFGAGRWLAELAESLPEIDRGRSRRRKRSDK